ncbi:MAG: hypothetical protein HKP58_14700 [Desulfatitalea sp.]|nr:hypothetical protein [Desulfatitalea sp.]NNK01656.1 hypothetical protein [Desulfatitalea sp.]
MRREFDLVNSIIPTSRLLEFSKEQASIPAAPVPPFVALGLMKSDGGNVFVRQKALIY